MSVTMGFVGVSTRASFIRVLFPRWAAVLGIESASVQGHDLPLAAPPDAYREVVRRIVSDPSCAGALVTSHKLAVLSAARDLFDELDPLAELTREVSCISKRDGRVVGHAKDPITAGRALSELAGDGYFRTTGAHVVCLGCGGAGTAILLHLLTGRARDDRPTRTIMVDVAPERLAALRELMAGTMTTAAVDFELATSPALTDRLVAERPRGSLVINATGLGKDRPGSPITDDVQFPDAAIAWDLNYRGELDFLRQARAQQRRSGAVVADGWDYFLHGWSEAIAEVFRLRLTPRRFAALRGEADSLRRVGGPRIDTQSS